MTKKVTDQKFLLNDVTDHNEIYNKLKKFTDSLDNSSNNSYTAAISSGTPAMQVAWILLAESGDFSIKNPLRLIKTSDPRFGPSKNIPVKLDSGLPRIISLSNEIEEIKRDLIPQANLSVNKGELRIGNTLIDLAPIEFCYYRYFAERVIEDKGLEKFSGFTVPIKFMQKIHRYHEESFYDFYSGREELGNMIKKEYEQGITTLRGNISKLNKKLTSVLNNKTIIDTFQIVAEGKRGAKFYGIKASENKLSIIK